MQDVRVDRDKYIGGSDIPIIMGLSKFKTRWQLLKEKAGIEVDEFEGNRYTEYGNVMEEKIRLYLDILYETDFLENKIIVDNTRYHADGVDENKVIEIKTTSREINGEADVKDYIVQLLYGMVLNKKKQGLLAIYKRPNDFSKDFDANRLNIMTVDLKDYQFSVDKIFDEVRNFTKDLERLKANPFLTENDLQPNEIQSIAQEVLRLEKQLAGFEELKAQHKTMKCELYEAMTRHDIKSWELPNGTKITRIAQGEDKEEKVFEQARFKKHHPELWDEFQKKHIKKGRAGYVRITV